MGLGYDVTVQCYMRNKAEMSNIARGEAELYIYIRIL